MARWGNQDLVSNVASTIQLATADKPRVIANGAALFHNTTPGAITNGMIVGLYGVTNTMVKAASANHATYLTGPGWTLVRQGTGGIANISVSVGGTGYNNTDVYTISGNSTVNATFHPVTNSTGGILSFTTNNAGFGFPNVAYTTGAFSNSTGGASAGSGATVTIKLGGRAGRINREVLTSVKTMTSSSNTPLFPNA
jgi:hypothetical protein